jgi:hypothetical protein
MKESLLNVRSDLAGISLVPTPIEVLGRAPKLDDEVAGQIRRLDLAPLLPSESKKGVLVLAHNDVGVRSSYEVATLGWFFTF